MVFYPLTVLIFRKISIVFLVICSLPSLLAQDLSYPYTILQYPFIEYSKNKIEFPADSNTYHKVSEKLHHLVTNGKGKLSILQIGGSHIQADIYSNVARYRLQNFYPGLNGGRGFVFPYSVAKTNNPVNLYVENTGRWTSVKNTQRNKKQVLGLAGISISTSDSIASLKICSYKSYYHYDFNRVKLFYKMDSLNYKIQIADSTLIDSVKTDSILQYSEYFLNQYIDTLDIKIQKTDSLNGSFTFYGATMETDDPGVVYHSIGINGSTVPAFLRCELLESQLKVINPDWIVLSLGTNDAYGKHFDSNLYYQNYDSLIQKMLGACPNAALLITVPNDDYLYKRRPNKFTAQQEDVIFKLAKKYNAGVWDLYKIMGGFNSSQTWYSYSLMKYDRIHFTKEGYLLKGDLFFNAILKMYDNYIESLDIKPSLLD